MNEKQTDVQQGKNSTKERYSKARRVVFDLYKK
jgi:hypothetical protein